MTRLSPQRIEAPAARSDASLVDEVLRGNLEAFSVLMRRYNQQLYRIVRGMTGDDATAEDVVQQAYLSAYRHLEQLEERAHVGAWLKRIAVREAFRARREAARLGFLRKEAEHAKVVPLASAPEQRFAAREWVQLVQAAIDELPDAYREVLVMRNVEHLSTEETADLLDVSQQNVRVRLHRARKLLAERLYGRAGDAFHEVYEFGGARCDSIVAGVLSRLRL